MILSEAEINSLNLQWQDAYPQEILRRTVAIFGERLAVVSSFQPTGIVALHLLHEMGVQLDVLTLDTGLLFPETYALMAAVEARFNLRLKRIQPALTVEAQAADYGPALWEHDPDRCCALRKLVPLAEALVGYEAWIAGLRRDQAATRTATPVIAWDSRHQKVKIAPLATWTEEMVWTYIHAYDLPYNPLHDRGYPSIGCWPCTRAVAAAGDLRAGRWVNHSKIECGIHTLPATGL